MKQSIFLFWSTKPSLYSVGFPRIYIYKHAMHHTPFNIAQCDKSRNHTAWHFCAQMQFIENVKLSNIKNNHGIFAKLSNISRHFLAQKSSPWIVRHTCLATWRANWSTLPSASLIVGNRNKSQRGLNMKPWSNVCKKDTLRIYYKHLYTTKNHHMLLTSVVILGSNLAKIYLCKEMFKYTAVYKLAISHATL